MELKLPVDHPIAQAIMNGGIEKGNHIILSVEVYEPRAWLPQGDRLQLEVHSWTHHGRNDKHDLSVPERVAVELFDPRERLRQITEMTL